MNPSEATTSSSGWKFGLLLLIVPGLVAGYVIWRNVQHDRSLERSSPALAYIERAERGGCLVGEEGKSCMALTLRVHPTAGEPYQVEVETLVASEWLSRVQAGQWMTVGVLDEQQGKQVLFDERTMSVPPPLPPASAAPH